MSFLNYVSDLLEKSVPGGRDFSSTILLVPTIKFGNSVVNNIAFSKSIISPKIKTPVQLFDYMSGVDTKKPESQLESIIGATCILKDFFKDDINFGSGFSDLDTEWHEFSRLVLKTRSQVILSGLSWNAEDWTQESRVRLNQGGFLRRDFFSFFSSFEKKFTDFLEKNKITDLDTQRKIFFQSLDEKIKWPFVSLVCVSGFSCPPIVKKLLCRIKEDIGDKYYLASFFDGIDFTGELNTKYWNSCSINIEENNIIPMDTTDDVINSVVDIVKSANSLKNTNSIAIGVSDDNLITRLAVALKEGGISYDRSGDTPLSEGSLYGILLLLNNWLLKQDWRSFSSLIRNPRILKSISLTREDVSLLDRYYSKHYPRRVPTDSEWPDKMFFDRDRGHRHPREIVKKFKNLLGPLFQNDSYSLVDNRKNLMDFLNGVYKNFTFDALNKDDVLVKSSLEILNQMVDVEGVCKQSAHSFIKLVLQLFVGKKSTTQGPTCDVEIFNWLDFSMSTKPIKIFIDMQSGRVPFWGDNGGSLLSRATRELVGVQSREDINSRDSYLMNFCLQESEHCLFFVPRKNSQGDSFAPSSLLFRDSDHQVVSKRVVRLINESKSYSYKNHVSGPGIGKYLYYNQDNIKKESYSVKDLRTYLVSPHRYVYESVLGGDQEIDDCSREMQTSDIGNLIHLVIERFCKSPDICLSTSKDEIGSWLLNDFDFICKERFRFNLISSVKIQLEQIKHRLLEFSNVRAERTGLGWRILSTEHKVNPGDFHIDVDGVNVGIHGRIDLIERHVDTNNLSVFDIKTGSLDPEKTHRLGPVNKKSWIDFQLPLYRLFVKNEFGVYPTEIGYWVVGPRGSFCKTVDWNKKDYELFEKSLKDCIRGILSGKKNMPERREKNIFNGGYERFIKFSVSSDPGGG